MLVEAAERLRLHLDDATLDRFAHYRALLLDWNERAGLTTVTEPTEVERRHFAESLALLAALRDAGLLVEARPARLVDLGPGGGFPSVPMALAEPAIALTLVESQARRAAFLESLVRELGIEGARIVHARAEEAGHDPGLRGRADLVVARALAPMRVLVEYALPLLREGGVLAAQKGSRALEELEDARGAIEALSGESLDPLPMPLPSDAPPQKVLLVRLTGEVDARYPRRPGMPSKRPL